jgi:HEAT repeat protein
VPNEVLPSLTVALDDREAAVRGAGVSALGELGAGGIGPLHGALKHRHADVRAAAVRTVALVDSLSDPVTTIGPSLADPDATVRAEAVQALGRAGEAARGAADAIKRLAESDPSAEVRAAAAAALERVAPPR